jgi:predicted nuclease of restriction endonuclease-like RecB superfamily
MDSNVADGTFVVLTAGKLNAALAPDQSLTLAYQDEDCSFTNARHFHASAGNNNEGEQYFAYFLLFGYPGIDDSITVSGGDSVTIDDILYENRIVHCYEKKVPIDSDEQTIKCDWFIPVTDSRHGIYIEYWGMNTKDYLQNKERKRKAYKDHDIPLIEIEKDDYRDRQGLTDRIISEINKLARKYFNITDYLK